MQRVRRSPLNRTLSLEQKRMARQWAREIGEGLIHLPSVLKIAIHKKGRYFDELEVEIIQLRYAIWANRRRGTRRFIPVDMDGRVIGYDYAT